MVRGGPIQHLIDVIIATIYYLVGDPDGPQADTVRAILNDILPGEGERIMSTAAEQWKAEGRAEGEARGRVEGRVEAKADMLQRLLRRRFKSVPDPIVSRITSATVEQLDAWIEQFVDAATFDDIFGPTLTH